MTSASPRRTTSLSAILLLALLLILAGAALALWGLSRYPEAASTLGIVERASLQPAAASRASGPEQPSEAALVPHATPGPPIAPADAAHRVATLEARIARIEGMTSRAEGSAIRADALLVAFAARRAIDRGVALGYLEPLLTARFGASHRQAVATIITISRRPIRLDQLTADFAALESRLKAAPPEASFWQTMRQELGALVSIRRSDQPSQRPSPTYDRAAARLAAGQVDQALAEAMRLPGISGAAQWVADARNYVAAHRALDQIESAALLAR